MRYPKDVRYPRRHLVLCALACAVLGACSQNKGPATSAYLRACGALTAKLAGQVHDLPAIAPPARPTLAPDPTPDQQRVFDGLTRIYPLYVNQYYAAVIERSRVMTQLCRQTLDDIGALNAAGVDPAGVQLMSVEAQAIDRRRDFFDELHRLADLSQTALVRRKAVDDADELLVGAFKAAVGGGDAAAVAGGLKDAAAAVSRRPGEPPGVAEQIARVMERAARLQQGVAADEAERSRLAADLRARYPGEDLGASGR